MNASDSSSIADLRFRLLMPSFFANSTYLDLLALRPLSHICGNWELTWDPAAQRYVPEEDSFAALVNELMAELPTIRPPAAYHDHEDRLAEYVRDNLRWPIRKVAGRWVGADYVSILSQGGFDDVDQNDLLLACAGRIRAARARNQNAFDDMEDSHQRMLAAVIAVILYHRAALL